jgi:DNA-binding NtrC family response regulator
MASILVAEDNNSLLRLLDSVLTAAGHEVMAASDAVMATEVAKQTDKPIDLLCAQLAIVGGSGAVLAEHLKQRYPEMKVLFIITENPRYVIVDTPDICKNDPAYGCIQKPFTLAQLVTRVEEMLKTGAAGCGGQTAAD